MASATRPTRHSALAAITAALFTSAMLVAPSAGAATSAPIAATSTPRCIYLHVKNGQREGGVFISDRWVLQRTGTKATGKYWTMFGEDIGLFTGTITNGRIKGRFVWRHIEGGGTSNSTINRRWVTGQGLAHPAGFVRVSKKTFAATSPSGRVGWKPCA